MSFFDQVLDLVPLAALKPLAPEEGNIALIPASAPTQRFGTLVHADAGPPGGGPPQRVLAVLGPGATFTGIAGRLLPLYAMASTGVTRDELARALVVYAKDYLQADRNWQSHLVGVLLPLPIEIDPATKAWILDADRIRTLALSFSDNWRSRLSTLPGALPVPDALDIEADAVTLTRGAAAPMLVQQFLTESMRNPSQQVLQFLAVLRVLDGKGGGPGVPGQAATAVLAALTGTTPDQLSVLAATTAGNGLLRRFAALLSIAPPGANPTLLAQARTSLSNALSPGGTPVVHQDVPEAVTQLAVRKGKDKPVEGAAADPPGGVHRLVLGRDVAVGQFTSTQVNGVRYTGPTFAGRVDLHAYLKADAANLNPKANPDMPALLVLLDGRPIAGRQVGSNPSGWRLDGVQARGPGLLAAGLDRWDATDPAGLPTLLGNYKHDASDEFDLFFGVHNLDVRVGPAGGPAFQLLVNGAVPAPADLQAFFGGTGPQGEVTFSSDWAARFRLPALVSAAYRRAQVAQATAQLVRTTDQLTRIIASVRPFPVTPYVPGSVASDPLKQKLTNNMNIVRGQAAALGAHDTDTLAAAVVDLTAATPAYGGFNDDDTFYVASLGKIMAMYAAYELRSRVQQVMDKVKAALLNPGQQTVFNVIGTVWGPQVCRVFPDFPDLNVQFPERFPSLRTMFKIAADGTVSFLKGPITDAAFAHAQGSPVSGTLFFDWMKGMILWSDDSAAGVTIKAIQYPYINGLLRAAGFYNPDTKRGLWLSANYAHKDWEQGSDLVLLSDRGQQHYKDKTNIVANAREVAHLLTLIATGQLFEGDAATRRNVCNEMIELMRKQWIITRVPQIQRGGTAIAGGPGSDTFFGNVIGLLAGDTISSKIGIGNPSPVTNLIGIHDCAIVTRTVAGHAFHYVGVVLGGFDSGVDSSAWDSAATAVDAAIRS
jgi:hypothetical protein